MRKTQIGVVLWLILLAGIGACESPAFIKGAVPDEAGFEGAVTVADVSAEGDIGVVTVNIPYRNVEGNLKMGQGRVIVRRQELESGKPIPAFCHVHYEKDVNGAKKWCEQGWAVFTAHYKNIPIDVSVGDGYNLARAVIQWARRLPFIDRSRLHIDGGSQGGYMALAMSADCFPVTATTADVPVVNWAYNFNYFEANKPVMKWPQEDCEKSPLPVVCSVMILMDWACKVFGNDFHSDTWYYLSPIAYLDWIANPAMIVCATGDMLVPMEQMTRTHLTAYDPALFPQGYQRDFDSVTICDAARKTFDELLPASDVCFLKIPLQENSFEITLPIVTGEEKKPGEGPKNIDRPWSKDHQWSICVLEEGSPAPYASHIRYEWATSPDSFVAAYKEQQPAPKILTAAKLDRLMQRYTGETQRDPTLADGRRANRLNFLGLEKLDVVTGLLDYAQFGDEYATRLKDLYEKGTQHPFGASLDLDTLKTHREELRAALAGQKSP